MGRSKANNPDPDARLLLNRAVDSEVGIRVRCDTSGKAQSLRQRCHTLIKKEREATMAIYEQGDPRYHASAFDILTFWREDEEGNHYTGAPRRKGEVGMDAGNWLVMKRLDKIEFDVEELT